MWDLNLSLFKEKLGVVSSLLILDCHTGVGIYIKIVSQALIPALMQICSFAQCVGLAQQVFFVRGNCFVCQL